MSEAERLERECGWRRLRFTSRDAGTTWEMIARDINRALDKRRTNAGK